MQILGLLSMYFDAVVVEVEKYLLFFRLALAMNITSLQHRSPPTRKIVLLNLRRNLKSQ